MSEGKRDLSVIDRKLSVNLSTELLRLVNRKVCRGATPNSPHLQLWWDMINFASYPVLLAQRKALLLELLHFFHAEV